ncbi:MAG TPA: alpha/beta hydrolase [Thermoleophilaceae bacterium]|nr:alpha/beta hydrolase [Thermoleophilaceae bacterium]
MVPTDERRGSVDGVETRWLESVSTGAHPPVLYVHGVPTAAWLWSDFLARTGGYAPDLPGFGESDKLASFDYSIPGYATWLRAFADQRGLDRFSLVVHDWGGGIGLALAQAVPERIERLAVMSAVPLLPGYRWHWVARNWRRPLIGELAMGFTFKVALRRVLNGSNRERLPASFVDAVWEPFDHGTQRAILKLYRSAPADVLAAAGANLDAIRCPALVVYGRRDPYLPAEFAQRYADALGGPATARVVEDAGHWAWLDEPSLVDEVARFVTT